MTSVEILIVFAIILMSSKQPSRQFTNPSSILKQEELVAEILRIRTASTSTKHWFQIFLESAGGAALISVVLGGLIGGYITARYQRDSKTAELELLKHQKFLEKREDFTRTTFELIGDTTVAAANLIRFKRSPGNDTTKYNQRRDTDKIKQINTQTEKEYSAFSETRQRWGARKGSISLLLTYYFASDEPVRKAWQTAQESVDKYVDFAGNCFLYNACDNEPRQEVESQTALFGAEIARSATN